jgi:hypothetical protein
MDTSLDVVIFTEELLIPQSEPGLYGTHVYNPQYMYTGFSLLHKMDDGGRTVCTIHNSGYIKLHVTWCLVYVMTNKEHR